MTVASDWNRARRHGKVTMVDMGAMGHTGRGGYLDHKAALPDGTFLVDRTVSTIAEIVQRHETRTNQQGESMRVDEPVTFPVVASA
jgi:hypothetical protein